MTDDNTGEPTLPRGPVSSTRVSVKYTLVAVRVVAGVIGALCLTAPVHAVRLKPLRPSRVVVMGHVVAGHMLRYLAMIGFLALSRTVVNDSLAHVEFAMPMRGRDGAGRKPWWAPVGEARGRSCLAV